MATWKVDSEMSLRQAVKGSAAGDTILVKPGDYHITMNERSLHDIKIDHSLTIRGDGGRANFYADEVKVAKGIFNLVLSADETVNFDNVGFLKAHSSSWNGAGIRHNGGDLNVTNSYFADSDMGILSVTRDASKRGDVTITNSEFNHLGYEKTHAHALYVLANNFTVENNYIHDTIIGHHVKSISANTVVRNNVLDDGMGTSSYAVDVGAGGDLLVSGNTITQGINGDNKKVISYQTVRFDGKPGKIVIDNNHIINLNGEPNASKVLKNSSASVAEVSNNKFEGFDEDKLFMGPFTQQHNTLDGKLLDDSHSSLTDPSGASSLLGDASPDDLVFDSPPTALITENADSNLMATTFNTEGMLDPDISPLDNTDLSFFLPDSFNPRIDALDDYIRVIKMGPGNFAGPFELRIDIDGPGQAYDFISIGYLQSQKLEDAASNFTFKGWDYI